MGWVGWKSKGTERIVEPLADEISQKGGILSERMEVKTTSR